MHSMFTINPLKCNISPRFLHQTGCFEVTQYRCHSSFCRPTLVDMETEIGKFQQKIGYNSAHRCDKRQKNYNKR